jgi:hypothetical protein
MTKNNEVRRRNVVNTLIAVLETSEKLLTREEVVVKAQNIANIHGYVGDVQDIVTEAMIAVDTRMGAGVSLVDISTSHDDKWVDKRADVSWTYTAAYEDYLRHDGWSDAMVQSLSEVTKRILAHLQDPQHDSQGWSRRGLVIGHVQSGKTANYTGLIARAADAGYKFIIVIAGIHNNLRKQTQQRIDAAFIGRSSDPNARRSVGVGLTPNYPHPATLTNINQDFNKRTAENSGWRINDFSRPIVLVVKKNVSTLTSLHNWLKELNADKGHGHIADVPMLMIDDEADNASINTSKDDVNPTKTNAMLRRILSLFAKSCYIGYTATPFANIFINPEAYDKEVFEELFPRDFIYSLDAPTTYLGAEKLFLDDDISQELVRHINDAEAVLPHTHKREHRVASLPDSLYKALDVFVVARAIRNVRGQTSKHCSMMINVSRFVGVQNEVRDQVRLYMNDMKNAVTYNYKMSEEKSTSNAYMQKLKLAYEEEYRGSGVTWEEVKNALASVFENLRTYVVNSKSDEVLEYDRYQADGVGLTAIAIGGLSLSRGLTIEGLTVSYMYRNTKMYDTLMQMGRWFGYRPGYEDICRVYLSSDSITWYSHIALAADELIQQIKRMRRDGLSPRQFGLYVLAHPTTLLITAPNKMRAAKSVRVKQNLSGKLIESYVVSIEREVNNENIQMIKEMWQGGFGNVAPETTSKGILFRDVNTDVIEDFLRKFIAHSHFSDRKVDIVTYLQRISDRYPQGDVVLVSPGGIQSDWLKSQVREVRHVSGTAWRLSKDRVASRGDEKLGLSNEQIAAAEANAAADSKASDGTDSKARVVVSDKYYRDERDKPLLMIHSLEPSGNAQVSGPIAAFGVSFPPNDYETVIDVVANQVWLEQMMGVPDEPDTDEDNDA